MKVLAIGDVVGPESVEYLREHLRAYARGCGAEAVIVNGENASKGNGISCTEARALLDAGADVVTTGNHVWKKGDIKALLEDSEYVIRPANFPGAAPGRGYTVIECGIKRLLVINLMGVSYMEPLDNPFDTLDRILAENEGGYDYSIVDFHAEATGEKAALANCFDGRVDAVFGTHTHVQTADARVLPGGTAFITDVGMTGPDDSVLGIMKDRVITKLRTRLPSRFDPAPGPVTAHGALFELEAPRSCAAVRF